MEGKIPRGTTVLPEMAEVHFDGACEPARGGGIATYGFTVEGSVPAYEECGLAVRPWSPHATNNVAEYTAAIRALEHLAATGFHGHVIVMGDSQLVIRQMTGEYEVRAPHLRAYHERLEALVHQFADVRFVWVRREENERADALSKQAFEAARSDARPHRPVTRVAVPPEDEAPE